VPHRQFGERSGGGFTPLETANQNLPESLPGFPTKSATTQTDPPSPLCDQLVNFNTQVQAAVSAVLEEWDTGAQNGRD